MHICHRLQPFVLALLCLVCLCRHHPPAPPTPPAELAWLCLQSLVGDCREVQQKQANRVLNVLASKKKSTNPVSVVTRRPEFPLAACDITRNRKQPSSQHCRHALCCYVLRVKRVVAARLVMGAVLHRGDWYHRRGFASDLCTAEWLKLSPERQSEYVKVQSLDDLGEQAVLYQEFHFPAPAPLDKALESKTQKLILSQQASDNHAGAQLHRQWQQLTAGVQLSRSAQLGILVSAVCVFAGVCFRSTKLLSTVLLFSSEWLS